MTTHYYFFAGEKSGDMYGSQLMHALKIKNPLAIFSGVGGPAMRGQGLEIGSLTMEHFQVMGFSDVLKNFPSLYQSFYQVRNQILKTKPEIVILIDYPGFNLRLAKALRKKGYKGKIVQYISPSVWAHGKSRITTMANTLDLLLTIFPFEKNYFQQTSLPVCYIGNPLVKTIQNYSYQTDWKKQLGILSTKRLIGVFPGSRLNEIERNLPYQLDVLQRLQQVDPTFDIALSCAQESLIGPIQKILTRSGLQIGKHLFLVPSSYRYELMRDCDTALAKSGTVTLELALHKRPTVVSYQVSHFNYAIAKYILRLDLPYYCIVNIINNKQVFPELIGKTIEKDKLYQTLKEVDQHADKRQLIIADCQSTFDCLGAVSSNEKAAQTILELQIC